MIPLADIQAARERIAGAAIRTPLVRLNADAPAEIHLKLECLQPIGSFKIRGASNRMALASKAELARGVWTASAGNMAQGVAWNAKRLGIPCTVVVPEGAPATKIAAVERLGGKVVPIPHDEWFDTFRTHKREGIEGTFVHAFSDDAVMAGNGTIGLELLEDLPELDTVLIPWGGGGLAGGIATALRALKPAVRIYAVEAETGAPLTASMKAGSPQVVDYQPSFVDGIGSKTVFPNMLVMAQELLDGSLTASLDEIAAALRLMAERNRVIAEGAGAVALAVALSGKAGQGRIACVVSGGNIDLTKLTKILSEH